MDFEVKVEGLDRIQQALPQVQQNVEAELRKALFASANQVEGEAKKSVAAGGKTGRIYKRRSVTHRSSAPGEAPASDTGRLLNSINAYPAPANRLESTTVAGRGTAKYAAMLEFGTTKMAARPFMFPALEKSKDWIRERLAKAVRIAATKSVR